MSNFLLSMKLQNDLVKALSVFHPEVMTAQQYMNCFDGVAEFVILSNI